MTRETTEVLFKVPAGDRKEIEWIRMSFGKEKGSKSRNLTATTKEGATVSLSVEILHQIIQKVEEESKRIDMEVV